MEMFPGGEEPWFARNDFVAAKMNLLTDFQIHPRARLRSDSGDDGKDEHLEGGTGASEWSTPRPIVANPTPVPLTPTQTGGHMSPVLASALAQRGRTPSEGQGFRLEEAASEPAVVLRAQSLAARGLAVIDRFTHLHQFRQAAANCGVDVRHLA